MRTSSTTFEAWTGKLPSVDGRTVAGADISTWLRGRKASRGVVAADTAGYLVKFVL